MPGSGIRIHLVFFFFHSFYLDSPSFPIIFRSYVTFFLPFPSLSIFFLFLHSIRTIFFFFFFFFFPTLMFVFCLFFFSFNSGISRSFSDPLRPNPPPFPNKFSLSSSQSASPGCPGRPSGCTCRRRCGPRLRSWGARTPGNRRC
jgi:hypothetical protein